MLLSFRVANHRSFYTEQELLLLPAYDKARPVTPVAGVYGANASGKSNLLDALGFMRRAVLESFSQWGPLGGVPRDRFALARSAATEPSTFGVDLLLDGQKYVYGFGADDDRVTEEWLYTYPHGRRRVLFERDGDDFRFGDTLRGPKTTIEEVTRPNSLFLSAAAQHNLDQLTPIFAWFEESLMVAGQFDPAARRRHTVRHLTDEAHAPRVVELMHAADLGISGIDIEQRVKPSDGIQELLVRYKDSTELSRLFVENFLARAGERTVEELRLRAAVSSARLLEWGHSEGMPVQVWNHRISPVNMPKVTTIRNTRDGPVELPLSEESRGTQAWFDFLGIITDTLSHGRVLLVDELDASLHPLLAREFVRLFQDEKTNPHGAQLLFTTHDTSLLTRQQGEEVLRRDEVWFTEKTQTGETRLFPLTDFKPRQGLNWERRYLGGAVGAVPFLDPAEFAAASRLRSSTSRDYGGPNVTPP